MDYIANKEVVLFLDKSISLEDLASKLALLSGEQMKKFFAEREIKIPRRINAMALTSALNESIQSLNSHSFTRDGFIKLESYANFTEFQLQSLFEKIGTDEEFFLYRKNLWKLLLRNHIGIKLEDEEVAHLLALKKTRLETFPTYAKALFEVTYDLTKEFDACPLTRLEDTLKAYFSLDELRLLASKYGIELPQRMRKEDLLQYVKAMMKARRKLTLVLQRELNDMTIVDLNQFCKEQELGISSSMKKDENIALFLFLIKQAKFPMISAKTIHALPFAEPLQFRIDFDVIDNFKRGLPKKVIYLLEDEKEKETISEPIEPTSILSRPKEDIAADIIKKLLPYLNVDEDAAKLAAQYGITLPKKQTIEKKTTTKSQKTIKKGPATTVKKTQTKKVDPDRLEEILKKLQTIQQTDNKDENSKATPTKTYIDKDKNSIVVEHVIKVEQAPASQEVDPKLVEEILRKIQGLKEPAQEPPKTTASEQVDYELKEENIETAIDDFPPAEIYVPSDEEASVKEEISLEPQEEQELEDESIEPQEEQVLEDESLESQEETSVKEPEDSFNEAPEELLNESYDEEFAPKEQNEGNLALIPVGPLVDLPVNPVDSTMENNPYFRSKKLISKKKNRIFVLSLFLLVIVVILSTFAIIKALQ